MIKAVFFHNMEGYTGFDISGHADAGAYGEDIICSAVSSAAYMTVNTVTEIIGAQAEVIENEGHMILTLKDHIDDCQVIFNGLHLHLSELAKSYNDTIRVCTKITK